MAAMQTAAMQTATIQQPTHSMAPYRAGGINVD
jgi:hypothetical protein